MVSPELRLEIWRGYTLIYPGRSRILHLQEFFFRLETTYCVSRTGVGVSDYSSLRFDPPYPPRSLHYPRTPAVSGCLRLCRNGAHLEGLSLSPESSTWREIRSRGELSTSGQIQTGQRVSVPSSGLKGGAGIRGHIWRTG